MAWRTVMIQNPARLTLSRGQLRIENDGGTVTLPLEDITTLVLESPQVALTSSLLSACQEQGIALITCDATHMPNGLLLPFQPHSRHSKVARLQLAAAEPLRKRLWQRIVHTKIVNQADCLDRTVGGVESTRVRALAERVGSGDPGNVEAQAARDYWPRFFGPQFRRGDNDTLNAALNYGYAVVRAFVARSQVAYGLLPTFGLHHDNELNAFNLTDDVMEVLRPWVDETAYRLWKADKLSPHDTSLSVGARQELANAGNFHCLIEEKVQTLATVCDRMAAGLVVAIESRSPAVLPLPSFCRAVDV